MHFFRKPWILAVENNYETESKYVMKGSRQVLVNLWDFVFFTEIWSLVISKPFDLEKSYIPLKKAVNSGKWNQFWNLKNFCHERLQTSSDLESSHCRKKLWNCDLTPDNHLDGSLSYLLILTNCYHFLVFFFQHIYTNLPHHLHFPHHFLSRLW